MVSLEAVMRTNPGCCSAAFKQPFGARRNMLDYVVRMLKFDDVASL